MNSDTSRPDPAAENDPRVSAAYRDLGTPSTPAELDRCILEHAATAARHRPPGLLQRWTRPLAWAATITICAAIVLEVSRTPGPDGLPQVPVLDLETAAPAAAELPRDAGLAAPADARAESEALQPGGPAEATPAAETARQRSAGSAKTAPKAAPKAAMSEPLQEQADSLEAARTQEAGTDAVRALAMPAAVGLNDAVAAPACDAEQRADPERWQACIDHLEQRGDHDMASRERELLGDAFPEFLRH